MYRYFQKDEILIGLFSDCIDTINKYVIINDKTVKVINYYILNSNDYPNDKYEILEVKKYSNNPTDNLMIYFSDKYKQKEFEEYFGNDQHMYKFFTNYERRYLRFIKLRYI